MQSDQNRDTDLRHLAGVLRQGAWIVIVLVIVAASVAYLLAKRAPNVYEATSEVRITNPNADNVFSSGAAVAVDPKRLVDTETGVIQSRTLRSAVDQKLGDHATGIEKVTVTNATGTDLLKISVTSESPELARDAANAFADVYVATRKAQAVSNLDQRAEELRSKADEIGKRIEALDVQIAAGGGSADALTAQRTALVTQQGDFSNRASQFEVESGLRSGNVQLVDQATLPTVPVTPKPARDAALAALIGLLLGVGLVLLLDRLDDRINDPDDLESITGGVPLIGSVPIYSPDKKRGAHKLPHGARSLVPLASIDAEVYRTLRSNLRFSNLGKAKSVIMVTSPSGSEGKSTVTANLAVALAESGQRVVVVSADLRRPVLSSIFGVDETEKGLTSVLLGDAAVTECLVPYTVDSGHKLYVLPAGPLPPNPAELLGSRAMADLLGSLSKADVDFVLVDCPPVLPVSDPLAVAQFVDGVILLSVVGQTKAHNLREACMRLDRVGADIIGVVLNGVPTGRGGRYPYQYYRRYGAYEYKPPTSTGNGGTGPHASGKGLATPISEVPS